MKKLYLPVLLLTALTVTVQEAQAMHVAARRALTSTNMQVARQAALAATSTFIPVMTARHYADQQSPVIEKKTVKSFLQRTKEFFNQFKAINTIKYNPLTRATTPTDAELLIKNGADVNAEDHDTYTPLMAAAINNNTELVKFLIKNGADVHAQNSDGYTAFMAAVADAKPINGNNIECLKILIEAGAHIDTIDKNGHTTFMLALFTGNNVLVSFLAESGTNVKMELELIIKCAADTLVKEVIKNKNK